MTRAEIIERLEKADGPDRELDAEIMFDLFAKPVGQKSDGGPVGYIWPEDNPSWNFGIRFPGKDREWFAKCRSRIDGETLLVERDGAFVLMNAIRIPALTASLDAAIALVERTLPGWYWRAGRTSLFPNGWANLHEFHPDHTDPGKNEFGYTGGKVPNPACALLVCLFRALEAKETGNG